MRKARIRLGLSETAEFMPPAVTFPNGCHMVEVEIDPETGVVKIVRYSIVEDIGNVLNPTLAHGQIQGGVAMGVGQALGEVITYDAESGQLISGSFMDYQMPRADDIPPVHLETRAVPTAVNPLGVKGVGEAGTVGSLVATINAICDALVTLGHPAYRDAGDARPRLGCDPGGQARESVTTGELAPCSCAWAWSQQRMFSLSHLADGRWAAHMLASRKKSDEGRGQRSPRAGRIGGEQSSRFRVTHDEILARSGCNNVL